MPTTLAGMSSKTNLLRCLAHSPIELRANSNEGGDNRARVAGVIIARGPAVVLNRALDWNGQTGTSVTDGQNDLAALGILVR